jgi:hypothetical protein
MKINVNTPEKLAVPPSNRGKVVLAQTMIRERVMLDRDGNEIDPKTKQIIRSADNQ